ncbi:hypothetical protein [Parasutterella secunda]|uniref:hypothetical protein n=1 Tax=Parasutterella secunda TaxID=626947 RepID=UPI0025A317E0|nr:hypothetical protein [Parasutterella secunda]MDM8227727.1 hypothetical protein [Parasutterella secunda]
MSNVTASITLSDRCKRTDIPRVLVAVDYFDKPKMDELERLSYKARLADVNYQINITTETGYKPRTAEQRLKQRLRLLETRAKKASELFWQEIVEGEIARRPDYYTLEGVKKTMDEIEKYLADSEIKHTPAFTLDELRDWLRKHSPFINHDLDRLMAFRYQCLERQKQINAMTPAEREEYLAQRRDNDPIAKKAFEAEGEREMLNLMRGV